MASTSTSSFQKSFKYDVFLSFRGEYTRNTFVGHLYNALEQHGIQTYKDDKTIEKGETIDTQLMESIEESRFFIIVFSKDYAGSSWCLDELVKIMECRKASEQTAYPIFYDVEPTEIRKQSGAVKEAFKKHENKEAAGKWRKALKEAADLAGWESKKTANGDESKLIQIIVDDIFKKICSSSWSVDRKLVGMEMRIEDFLSSLELDAQEVRMIGIWGMGGGGKTTLARAVFDKISTQFDGKAFVENVREVSKSSLYGLNKLQEQVLSSVLSKENITVNSVHEGTNMMKRIIRGIKVLIVLDDVDDIEQLEALAGEPEWFKLGSRVIITTRDKQVLLTHQVKFINDVNLLSPTEAICLLSKYAFKRDIPIEGYEELSKEVVRYADGLPLTIKVLGSLLCGQNVPQWIDTLERLKKIPLKATMEKLELSYNGLEKDYKEIFLDVACLLKGWRKDKAVIALESCGFFAEAGLRVLEQRSLINISEDEELGMHDYIEEMGKNIVRRVNPNKPEMHSRLWNKEEIKDILANHSGTQEIKCITLDADGLNCIILVKGLTNMKELRFLRVYNCDIDGDEVNTFDEDSEDEVSNWSFDEDNLHLPNALRYLEWDGYPFSSLPKTFQAKNLVGLEMEDSNMVQLWKDGEEKACLKLRFLKVTSSELRTLDLSVAPNLETLILEKCANLVEVHFHVTPNLKELRIFRCYKLEKLHMPAESPELRSLDLDESSKLRTLHLGKTPKLETLSDDDGGDDEGKRMKEQIAKEKKLEFLIHELKEIQEVRHQKKPTKRGRSLKREIAKVWKEIIILKKESEQEQVDKRWRIQEEVANLFDVALKFSFPEFPEEKSKIFACIEKYGDYQCENVLSIWPKLREKGTVHLGSRRVGWKIKRNLELLRSEMLEREPWVLDIGFVSIKLSGKWMAKSIYKMLKDGIDTWAPKLLMESVLVNFPSCGTADLMPMDLLRREFIKMALIRMLQYCKIGVEFSMPCGKALPKEQYDKFLIEEKDGDVLIFRKAEGEQEPLIHAKRDGCSGKPMEDLADLWYGLEEKKANWIVCVTPVQQQEYIKMCIKAAQHAEWLPPKWRDSPRASYTGFQTYNTKIKHEDLDSFLGEAKSKCAAAAKELGYTGEEVVNCALKYTILKNNRLADYTFNSQEMRLNVEGNTFVYLLNTQARIRSFTKEARKDIHDFDSELELTLGKGEIWKEGVERVLVQHLLVFTQVIEESCLPVLPHILCEYLYDLSKNFNSVCEVGFVAQTTKLLLCEATEVVMEKCFQLLGITPESSFLGVDWPRSSSGLTKSLLQVERLNHKDPPKITTRFELFSVYPYITRDPNFRKGNLFGLIAISDTYNLLSDGWGLTSVPDHGYVALFDCDWPYSIDITNHRGVYFGNPSSRNLVPISSSMEVRVELYASTERNDTVFELCNRRIHAEFVDFLEGKADTRHSMWISEGKDGHIRMYFILLKDAIDSAITITYFPTNDGGEVFAEIFAYYGSDFFHKKVDPFEKNYYTARLFRNTFDTKIPKIPLERSMLAVPAKGSIVIVARLWDVDSGVVILDDSRTFLAGCGDEQKIEASCGSLHVSVDWSQG